jgi:DNA mismatch repair ATPase MutS
LAEDAADLARLASATSRIARRTRFLIPERGYSLELADILQEYVSAFFLVEARAFCGFLEDLEHHRDELRRVYEVVGELDALQSAASFRAGLPEYVEPELVEDGVNLALRDGKHPLVEDPVPNSIETCAGGIFVTGPNMAGKTTFLRTVAVNALMAQSICTCYASAYRASFFRIISSITRADELEAGVSYYLVEAERLLRIVRAAEGDMPCLCVVDEMLVGTNWAERRNASVAILDYLRGKKAIIIVSSHDVDLVSALETKYKNYHFADYVDEDGPQFDYVLREGLASGRNAIRLLERLGYPEEIVAQARKGLYERS